MQAISLDQGLTALSVLKSGQKEDNSALGFLNSSVFSVSSIDALRGIADAFWNSEDLREEFTKRFDDIMRRNATAGMHKDNAKHVALTDVIMNNRKMFPPESFEIHTELPDGASITTKIPSLVSMSGDIFAKEVAERQEAFDAKRSASNAPPDASLLRLDDLTKALRELTLNEAEQILLEPDDEPDNARMAKDYLTH
jgi:hypothetical protein